MEIAGEKEGISVPVIIWPKRQRYIMFGFIAAVFDFLVDTILLSSNDQKYRDIAINNNIKYKKK